MSLELSLHTPETSSPADYGKIGPLWVKTICF